VGWGGHFEDVAEWVLCRVGNWKWGEGVYRGYGTRGIKSIDEDGELGSK
jgi:hypothetical protein